MTPRRRLAISAGTLRGSTPTDAVRLAAGAGFDALGARFDLAPPSERELRTMRTALDDTGLTVLDLEVVRIQPADDAELTRRLTAWGAAVGAEFLLTVSEDSDRGRTVDRFAETCAIAADRGMRVALEFMRFTAVPTLSEACEVVAAAGAEGACILVDPLHLARSGGVPAEVAGVDPVLLPYAQFCDAPATDPPDPASLADEARHARLMPGQGELPLEELLAALPARATLSVEVLSDEWDGREREEVARVAMATTTELLVSHDRGARTGAEGDGPSVTSAAAAT